MVSHAMRAPLFPAGAVRMSSGPSFTTSADPSASSSEVRPGEHRLQQDLDAGHRRVAGGVLGLVVRDVVPAGREDHGRGRDA